MEIFKISKEVDKILNTNFYINFIEIFSQKIRSIRQNNENKLLKKTKSITSANSFNSYWSIIFNKIFVKNNTNNLPELVVKFLDLKINKTLLELHSFAKINSMDIATVLKNYLDSCYKRAMNHIKIKKMKPSIKLKILKNSSNVSNSNKSNPRGSSSKKLLDIENVLIESDEDKKPNKENKNEFKQLNNLNRLNLYLGDFHSINQTNINSMGKFKIYTGKLLSSYVISPRDEKTNFHHNVMDYIELKRILEDGTNVNSPNKSQQNNFNNIGKNLSTTIKLQNKHLSKRMIELNKFIIREDKNKYQNNDLKFKSIETPRPTNFKFFIKQSLKGIKNTKDTLSNNLTSVDVNSKTCDRSVKSKSRFISDRIHSGIISNYNFQSNSSRYNSSVQKKNQTPMIKDIKRDIMNSDTIRTSRSIVKIKPNSEKLFINN